ncbi:MAG: hypothetical protein AB1503_11590 [Bacillota bacterium]
MLDVLDAGRLETSIRQGLQWIESHVADDGEVRPAEGGIAAYYKMLFALSAGGRVRTANRVADWVRRTVQTEEGDFAPNRRGRVFSRLYVYPNAWLVYGAHRLGRLDVSRRGASFLLSFRDEPSGAFHSMRGDALGTEEPGPYVAQSEAQSPRTAELMCTAMSGLALLYVGYVREAVKAGDFLCRMLASQPRPGRILYTMYDLQEQRLITDYPMHLSQAFAVDAHELAQYYFQLGIAAAFLSKLYAAVRQDCYVQAARGYLDFISACREDRFSTPQSGKLAWGSAYLVQLTGEEKYLDVLRSVTTYLCESQYPDGHWGEIREPANLPGVLDLTNEFVSILIESLSSETVRSR